MSLTPTERHGQGLCIDCGLKREDDNDSIWCNDCTLKHRQSETHVRSMAI